MNPSDYRRDYAAYCSARQRERYRHYVGLTSQSNLELIEERAADLWTLEAIDELRRAWEQTPPYFETERAGLRALLNAARLKFLEAQADEVTKELNLCVASARIAWDNDGARPSAEDVPEKIASESDAQRRRELASRLFDALRSCDHLRAARLESLRTSARALGFDGLRGLDAEVAGTDSEKLAATADAFLERTAPVYMRHLAGWATRELSPDAAKSPGYADGLFFGRAARLDKYFPAGDFLKVFGEVMNNLGINIAAQPNMHVETASARALKKSGSACFAVSPPDDVRFVVGAGDDSGGGASWFRASWHETARAQQLAWASRETASRHPEFISAPDGGTCEGHAFLFSSFLYDAAWLGGPLALRASEAEDVASACALRELADVRRACAALRYHIALDEAKDARSDQTSETYASLHHEATGFRHDAATGLFDAEISRSAATRWRAKVFAAGFREHLRTRYGRRWYERRAAGDELRDVWNTASRYTVEELARMVWGGDLDFNLLADELIAALEV